MQKPVRTTLGVLIVTLVLTGALQAPPVLADYIHGGVAYVPVPNAKIPIFASRYDIGLIEGGYGPTAVGVNALNPDMKWFVYNSGTDNYVTGAADGEHQAVIDIAAENGWSPEDAYMHYWDDTWVTIEGETIFVPGWGGGSATDPADARVPIYYKTLTRRLVNLSGKGAYLNRKAIIRTAFETPFRNSSPPTYADGVFLDNCSYILYHTGTVISGGRVRETPGQLVIGTSAFQDWFWNENAGPFYAALKDTLDGSAAWTPDGKKKESMVNISNVWTDTYVTFGVAHHLALEFQYSPVRNHGLDGPLIASQRDALAASNGIRSFYLSRVQTTAGGVSGSYTYQEAQLGNIAWWLTTKTDKTAFWLNGTVNPAQSDWETKVWTGVLDDLEATMGPPTGDIYLLQEGTDPLGKPYKVWARDYAGGMSVVRARGDWNQGIGTNTQITLNLPEPLASLDPDGNAGGLASTISIRNGQGLILVREGGANLEGPPSATSLSWSMLLVGTSPRHGTSNVPINAPVRILFSDPLPGTVNPAFLSVVGSVSGTRSGSLSLENNGTTLVFEPTIPWVAGETVTVHVDAAVHRQDGEALDANADGSGGVSGVDDYEFQFVVAP